MSQFGLVSLAGRHLLAAKILRVGGARNESRANEAGSQSITHTGRGRAGQDLYAPTQAEQRTARIMGAWFLGTFVFSIPAYFFYGPILNNPNYVVGSGDDIRVAVGALLEILLAISGIATAVVIFPIVKRVNESPRVHRLADGGVDPHSGRRRERDVGGGPAAGSCRRRKQWASY
jgi:Domain of unknown function (DUF4386)